MRKLFTLIGALLLWQTVAVAQNYLHITTGESTKIVPMDNLDSMTVRDKAFYGNDWEYLSTGTYTYKQYLEGTLEGHTIYVKEVSETLRQYKIVDWYYGYPLTIDYDIPTGRCHIQPQETGYIHDTYGMLMITDLATFTGDEENYKSTFNEETGLFELCVIYFVEAGRFNDGGYEYLQLDKQSRAKARNRNTGEASLIFADKEFIPTKQAIGSRVHTPIKPAGKQVEAQQLMQVPQNQIVK